MKVDIFRKERNYMMKKLISLVLMVALTVSTISVLAFTDMPNGDGYRSAIEKLSALEILNGYEDGTVRPDNYVTRAEFAKLVVLALGKKEMATGNAERFWDLKSNHWASGYINFVAENGYIKGYPDGSFAPNENIPFEQVITILIRMLGYSTEDVGYHWPKDYIEKGSMLGITDDIYYNSSDWMTRKDVALLLARTLDTNMNGDKSSKLINTSGFTLLENVTILASKNEDASLQSDAVKTSNGTYQYVMPSVERYVGMTGSIYLNKKGKIQFIEPKQQMKKTVVVNAVVDNTISYTENGVQGVIKPNDNTLVYSNGQTASFATAKGGFTQGSTLMLYYNENNALEYIVMDTGTTVGPVTLSHTVAGTDSFDGIVINEETKIYRNGIAVKASELKLNDILYYTPSSNVVMAYNETRTGIYEEAYPTKAFPTSIKLSGVNYEIESEAALNKLNESAGAYKKNQKITLLLGKDGKIADVRSSTDADLAVVISTSKEISTEEDTKGKTYYYIKVLRGDGKEYSYKAEKDFSSYRGALVQMESGEDGLVTALARKTSAISGAVDLTKHTIGKYNVATDCEIIELLRAPGENDSYDAEARKIQWEDIDLKELSTSDVIHAETDKQFGDITFLYLKNISNDMYQYGILKNAEVSKGGINVSGRYTLDLGGVEKVFSLKEAYSIGRGTPIAANIVNNQLVSMSKLLEIGSGASVQAVDYNRIKVGGTVYSMSPSAIVYRKTNTYFEKETISLNELEEGKFSSVQLYADKSVNAGGRVRVIVVS